jgi:hypothetical protein
MLTIFNDQLRKEKKEYRYQVNQVKELTYREKKDFKHWMKCLFNMEL